MASQTPDTVFEATKVDGSNSQAPPHHARRATSESVQLLTRLRSTAAAIPPFAGRLGGNQEFALDRSNPINASLVERVPDAAPNLSLSEAFDMRGFMEPDLYKAAVMEVIGTMLLDFTTSWNSLSPNIPPPPPDEASGIFSTVTFLGPLIGNVQTVILVTLLIYSFGAVSGAHFNPLITLATFFARLTTFPRATIYVAAQLLGATLAGLMLRAGQSSRNWKVGGCFLFEPATVGNAMAVEIMASTLLIFLAFGVGLDPRQRSIFGPALSPILVGVTAGTLALAYSYSLPGYGGASMNPARCFGAFVGSRFPGWHWIHWVGALGASSFHGLIYWLIPPICFEEQRNVKAKCADCKAHQDALLGEKHAREDGSNV